MSDLESKIKDSERIIRSVLSEQEPTGIYFSGGKDSMVLLHLIVSRFGRLPVVFHREPFHTIRFEFANAVLAKWDMRVFDYAPCATHLWEGKGIIAYTYRYEVGRNEKGQIVTLDLPKNIIHDPTGVCGLQEIIDRPLGTFTFPWKWMFHGHKSSDEDQIAGKVPLHVDAVRNEFGPSAAFPLRNWTDSDVWDYIEKFDVPYDADRYDKATRSEHSGKVYNSDYTRACIKCMDKREGATVMCPKMNLEINNISARIPYAETKLEYFGEKP